MGLTPGPGVTSIVGYTEMLADGSVVDPDPLAQEGRAVTEAAGDEADEDRPTRRHEAGSRGDRDETRDGAACGTDDADLAMVEVARTDPRERRRGSRSIGNDECAGRKPAGGE